MISNQPRVRRRFVKRKYLPIPTLSLPLKGRGSCGSSPFKGEVGRGMGWDVFMSFQTVTVKFLKSQRLAES